MDIVDKLRLNGQGCKCLASHSKDCQCDATWADYYIEEAVNEIVHLRRLVAEYEDTIRYLSMQVSRSL